MNKGKSLFLTTTIAVSLLFLLTACNERKKQESAPATIAEAVTKLEDEGKYPKLDRTESLLGEDKDSNGVRDDIDVYIDSLPDTPEQKGALRQFAASLNFDLSVDLNDDNAIAEMHYLSGRAINCLHDRYVCVIGEQSIRSERFKTIIAFNYNTKERVEASSKIDQALSGTNWKSPTESCDEKFIK